MISKYKNPNRHFFSRGCRLSSLSLSLSFLVTLEINIPSFQKGNLVDALQYDFTRAFLQYPQRRMKYFKTVGHNMAATVTRTDRPPGQCLLAKASWPKPPYRNEATPPLDRRRRGCLRYCTKRKSYQLVDVLRCTTFGKVKKRKRVFRSHELQPEKKKQFPQEKYYTRERPTGQYRTTRDSV